MPSLETSGLIHRATIWVAAGVNDHGEWEVAEEPVELRVRYENKGLVTGFSPLTGAPRYQAAMVLDREVPVGSWVHRGPLSELGGAGAGVLAWTRNVRASVLGMGQPWSLVLPAPGSGTTELAVRMHLVYLAATARAGVEVPEALWWVNIYEEYPDLKGRNFYRQAGLARMKGEPT